MRQSAITKKLLQQLTAFTLVTFANVLSLGLAAQDRPLPEGGLGKIPLLQIQIR